MCYPLDKFDREYSGTENLHCDWKPKYISKYSVVMTWSTV